MGQAVFGDLKRNGAVENRFAILLGDNAARRKAAAIANGVDFINDGPLIIAGPQKIGVERMRAALWVNRAVACIERLRSDLPPKDARKSQCKRVSAK